MLEGHQRLWVFVAALGLTACGGVVQFAGGQPVEITGTAPVAPPPRVRRARLNNNRIEITDKIQFEADKAIIKGESSSLLDEIADVMRNNPQVKKISIEGHASSDGNPQHNQQLSAERASAVMDYLVKKEKIDASRLAAKGWGSQKPIAPNDTAEGREKNRRVEFLVVDQGHHHHDHDHAAPEKK